MTWYPPGNSVPAELRTEQLWLRPLCGSDAELDFEALMSSAAQLRRWSQSLWPADDFTLAQNRADLDRHEREHHAREAFTYTVLSPDGSRCLGCVYLSPLPPAATSLCPGTGTATRVTFWVRTSELVNDLDVHLLSALRRWFVTAWSFTCTVFVVSPQDTQQAELLSAVGLLPRAFALPDGRAFWGFAEHPRSGAMADDQ